MTCERIDLLIGLTEDALDPGERGPVESHLEGCATCREVVAGYRETATALQNLERPEPSAEATERTYAAMMALMEADSVVPETPASTSAPAGAGEATGQTTPRPLGRLIPFFRVVAAAACLMLVLMLVLDERQRSGVAKVSPSEHEATGEAPTTALGPPNAQPAAGNDSKVVEKVAQLARKAEERDASADRTSGAGLGKNDEAGRREEAQPRGAGAPPAMKARVSRKRQPRQDRPEAAGSKSPVDSVGSRLNEFKLAKGKKKEGAQLGAGPEERGSGFIEGAPPPPRPTSDPAPGGSPTVRRFGAGARTPPGRARPAPTPGRPTAPAKPMAKAGDGGAEPGSQGGGGGAAPPIEGAWVVKANGASRLYVLRGDRLVSRSLPSVETPTAKVRRARRRGARPSKQPAKKQTAAVTAAPVPRRSWGRSQGEHPSRPVEASRDREALVAILAGELRGRWGADPGLRFRKRSLRGRAPARENEAGPNTKGGAAPTGARKQPAEPADDAAPSAGKRAPEAELKKTKDEVRALPPQVLARVQAVFRALGVKLPAKPTQAELLSALQRLEAPAQPKAKSKQD